MKTAIKVEEAAGMIPDGAVLLIGGFMAVGSPLRLIDAIVARGAKDLTVVANEKSSSRSSEAAGRIIDDE